MGRWKEKRKRNYCTKSEHKGLELRLENLNRIYTGETKALRAIIEERNVDLQHQRNLVEDLEGALIKASLLVEVQQKQINAIKLILDFFEPAKSISATELKALQRVAKDVRNRTEDTSNAGTPRPNSNC